MLCNAPKYEIRSFQYETLKSSIYELLKISRITECPTRLVSILLFDEIVEREDVANFLLQVCRELQTSEENQK